MLRARTGFAALLLLAAAAHAEAPRVYAHRGATESAPENSLAACAAAFALGASCEIDVRAARDGALVLMHDATLARTTSGRGRVASFRLAELRALPLRGATSERVPTLADALALPRAGHALLLDLKQADEAFHRRLASAVARAPASGEIVLGVRGESQARALRRLLARHAQVALIEAPREVERLAAAGAEHVRLKSEWLAREAGLAERVRASGARLLVLLDDGSAGALDAALAHTPDALLCDDPAAALARIAARKP